MKSDIEKLRAFHSLSSYLDKGDKDYLLKKLGFNETDLEARLNGLRSEDEFALILYFSESCKHILAFDEGISYLSKSFTPDMLVENNSGKKIFVEIKSLGKKSTYKISGGNLKQKQAFADNFGFELYFAIKIWGHWGLFPSSFVKSNSGKIGFPVGINNSELHNIFGINYFLFKPGLQIESVYSKSNSTASEIRHEDFGTLISYKLTYNGILIYGANENNKQDFTKGVWLEHLQDLMSVQSQNIRKLDDDLTEIIEKMVNPSLCPDYSFFMAPINHMMQTSGLKYDSTSYLKGMLAERKNIPLKKIIHEVLDEMKNKGVEILIPTTIEIQKDGSFITTHDQND